MVRSAPKFTLRRVRLNAGGYDSAGSYFGAGAPLYWFDDDSRCGHVRATLIRDPTIPGEDRARLWRRGAKAAIAAQYPDAVFLR